MMDINFYVKSMGSFIILSAYEIWEVYPNVTFCTLTRQSSGNWGRHAKHHAFLYQLWTTEALLNILLGPPNHDSQNSPDETHELGSWAKNEMMCHKFEPLALSPFLWIRTLLGFKIDSPKIYDNIDVVRVANEMKQCGVKNLSSTPINLYKHKKTKFNSQCTARGWISMINPLPVASTIILRDLLTRALKAYISKLF